MLKDISFHDSLIGFMVGGENNHHAQYYKTTNGGLTWAVDSATWNYSFNGVDAKQLPVAWIAGGAGSILKTTTSGNSWTVIRNTDIEYKTLANVFFYDINRGWAIGTEGAITHTTNGGTVWQRQVSSVNSYLWGISFPDSLHGKITTSGGGVLGTRDRGNTWIGESTGATSPLYDIVLVDTLYGVASFTLRNLGQLGGLGAKFNLLEISPKPRRYRSPDRLPKHHPHHHRGVTLDCAEHYGRGTPFRGQFRNPRGRLGLRRHPERDGDHPAHHGQRGHLDRAIQQREPEAQLDSVQRPPHRVVCRQRRDNPLDDGWRGNLATRGKRGHLAFVGLLLLRPPTRICQRERRINHPDHGRGKDLDRRDDRGALQPGIGMRPGQRPCLGRRRIRDGAWLA